MRIAIFHELPTKSGSRKSINNIARILKENHIVDLYIVDSKKNSHEKKFFTSIYFYPFICVKWKGNNWGARLYRDTIELVNLYFLHKSIAMDIRKKRYDFVFIHGSQFTESPFILRFVCGFKVYYAHASNYSFVYESIIGIPQKDFLRYIYEKLIRCIRKIIDKGNVISSDLILANSKYTKRNIQSFYNTNSCVSYLGVDTTRFKPQRVKKYIDVLFIGSTQPLDGYSLLQDAIRFLKNPLRLKSVFIEKQWIVGDKKLSQLYNRAKIVVCLAYNEPFGLISIEAQACGVPVIAVNEGGYKESILQNKTGLLIERDSLQLAQTIDWLLTHPLEYKVLKKNARNRIIQAWDLRKTTDTMLEIIKKRKQKILL